MSDFRLCLTCESYSQASLCHYTLQLISDQLELTFAHLRYSLGGQRPIQTTYHTMSLEKVRIQQLEEWYFNIATIKRWRIDDISFHLFYTSNGCIHYKAVVKVHGVLPSYR